MELVGDALFDTGSAALKAGVTERLREFVDRVLRPGAPLKAIDIVGHTDSTGSDTRNRELSLARAVAVRDLLVASDIDPAILSAAGVGAEQPVASNASAEGRARNRRVELHVQRVE